MAAGWWLFRRGDSAARIDLIEQLATAEKRPADRTFPVSDVTINGETHKAIDATLRLGSRGSSASRRTPGCVHVGLKPESFTAEGDGVLFFVVISDGRADMRSSNITSTPSRTPASASGFR